MQNPSLVVFNTALNVITQGLEVTRSRDRVTIDSCDHVMRDGCMHYGQLGIRSTTNTSDIRLKYNYTYEVKVQQESESAVVLVLVLESLANGIPTSGGSSFRLDRFRGLYCPFTDHYDGRYTARCTFVQRTGCGPMLITRQANDFSSYRTRDNNRAEVVVYNETVCVELATPPSAFDLYRRPIMATWTDADKRTTRLTHNYGVPVTTLNSSTMCRRLFERYDNVVMVGASHMRYSFDYLLAECNAHFDFSNIRLKHGDFRRGKLSFNVALVVEQFNGTLEKCVRKYGSANGTLYVLQFGAHDLADKELARVLYVSVDEFVTGVLALVRCGCDVVVRSTPPFPDRNFYHKKKGCRNNYAISAFNYRVWKRVVELQVGRL